MGDSWAIRPAVKSAVKSGGKSLNTFGRGGGTAEVKKSLKEVSATHVSEYDA